MIPIPFDYETLRVIWWILLGVLLAGVAIFDGFDYGVAMMLPWLAKNDIERRTMINTISPVWEGNQVWLIVSAGALFAAWPAIYAIAFSGFYIAMLIVLLALILRPVAFKYRSKIENQQWKNAWDTCLFIGGFVPPLIFGVAIGNVLQGVPFNFDDSLRVFYSGNFFQLLNPFALLCGLVSVCMLLHHGSCYLNVKTDGYLQQRVVSFCRVSSLLFIFLFLIAGLFISYYVSGYHLMSDLSHTGPSNPLHKLVALQAGAWIINYKTIPALLVAPAITVLSALCVNLFLTRGVGKLAFVFSSISILGVIATVGFSMFPFLLPSSSEPNHSLVIWDASSSQMTLFIMLIATMVCLPIVLLYTAWVYRVLRGKVSVKNEGTIY